MLHQNALQAARIHELEEQLAEMTKRNSRTRKRIQQGGTIQYRNAAAQVAAEASAAPQRSKKARGGTYNLGNVHGHCNSCGPAPCVREHQIYDPTPVSYFPTTTRPNCMQLSEVPYRINAKKLHYLNLLGRLMLHPLLVTLGRDTGVASPPLPTPDAPPPSCLIVCFLEGLFDIDFKANFLLLGGDGADLASSLSLFELSFGPALPSPSPSSLCLTSSYQLPLHVGQVCSLWLAAWQPFIRLFWPVLPLLLGPFVPKPQEPFLLLLETESKPRCCLSNEGGLGL